MKRVLIVNEDTCPLQVHTVDPWNGGKEVEGAEIQCARRLFKEDRKCSEENCPLPKIPERKQEKIYLDCNPDAFTYDTRAEGWNACLDAITGGTS